MLTLESPHQDFSYPPTQDDAGEWRASLSVFSNDETVRAAIESDLGEAGFRLAGSRPLAALMQGAPALLGDVVVVDCPAVAAGEMAALARLDERVARSGARLVVVTCSDLLETLYLCFERARVHWLVDASPGERLVALAEARLTLGHRVRELSSEDRATLENLTEQVAAIARRLDQWSGEAQREPGSLSVASPSQDFHHENGEKAASGCRAQRPPLPDPRLVRAIIQRRQARLKYFPDAHLADPAWDMLLDLTAARVEHTRVSVTSLCIASGVPTTTALRWIGQLEEIGLVERVADDIDKRRAFIALTDKAADAMAQYFSDIASRGLLLP